MYKVEWITNQDCGIFIYIYPSTFFLQDVVIQKALNCLRGFISNVTDSYSLALFSYTFNLAKDKYGADLFGALRSKAIVEGQFQVVQVLYVFEQFSIEFHVLRYCFGFTNFALWLVRKTPRSSYQSIRRKS